MYENVSLCYLPGSDWSRRRDALDNFLTQCADTFEPPFTCNYDDVGTSFNVAVFSDDSGLSLVVALLPWDSTALQYPIAELYAVGDGWTNHGTIYNDELSGLSYSGDTPDDYECSCFDDSPAAIYERAVYDRLIEIIEDSAEE